MSRLNDFLKVRRAQNGWILENVVEGESDEIYVYSDEFYYSENDRERSEAEAFSSLLGMIHNLMGPMDSRYSKHRVRIKIEPGDKCEIDEQEDEQEGQLIKW
jgi:hypothetical protein